MYSIRPEKAHDLSATRASLKLVAEAGAWSCFAQVQRAEKHPVSHSSCLCSSNIVRIAHVCRSKIDFGGSLQRDKDWGGAATGMR